MYDDLTAMFNGKDILFQMELRKGALLLTRDIKARTSLITDLPSPSI
jgi:hypothetical protein